MKKTCSILLALAMVLALSVPALATSLPTTGNNDSHDVEATYNAGTTNKGYPVYSITLTWSNIDNLVYTSGNTVYNWQPDTHTYKPTTSASSWTKDSTSFSLKVDNDSDVGITATATFAATGSLTAECTGTNWSSNQCVLQVESAAKDIADDFTGTGETQSGTISGTVKVTGGSISADTKVGTITVVLRPTV